MTPYQRVIRPASADEKKGWLLIGTQFLFTLLTLIAGFGIVLVPVWPLSTLMIGLYLYFRAPALYNIYVLWIALFGEFVRRLIDFRAGFLTPGPWFLAPMLLASISLLSVFRSLSNIRKQGGWPFILIMASLAYAFVNGCLSQLIGWRMENEVDKFLVISLSWIAPAAFGCHLFTQWRGYLKNRENLKQILYWSGLCVGLYGILQFVVAPPWDAFYINEHGIVSFGYPRPFGLRVFSTFSSPFICAAVLNASLMLNLGVQSDLRAFGAGAIALISLLLTRVRSGWMGLLVGILSLLILSNTNQKMRDIFRTMVFVLIGVAVFTIGPFAETLSARLESFSALESDTALNSRVIAFSSYLGQGLTDFVGNGFGSETPLSESWGTAVMGDSDGIILSMLFQFGSVAALAYLLGIVLIFVQITYVQYQLYSVTGTTDVFLSAIPAMLASMAPLSFSADLFPSVGGILFWALLGVGLAATQFYSQYVALKRQQLLHHP